MSDSTAVSPVSMEASLQQVLARNIAQSSDVMQPHEAAAVTRMKEIQSTAAAAARQARQMIASTGRVDVTI